MTDPLVDLVARTARMLDAEGFSYALIGALARNAWARPRATTDADFAVSVGADQVDRLRAALAALGLLVRKELPDRAGGPVPELLLLVDGRDPTLRLDLLVAHTPFEASVLARRVRTTVAGVELFVATAEDLLVYKLVAGRPRDLADVEEVARTRADLGAEVDWAYVERWADAFGVAGRVAALRTRLEAPG